MSGELPSDVNPYQIEPELSAYAPRPARIDRDRLMFEAGCAAAVSHPPPSAALALRPGVIAWFPAPQPTAPTTWAWPVCTAAMTLVATGLGLALLLRPAPLDRVQVVERVVQIPSRVPQAVPDPTLAVSSGGLNQAGHDFAPRPAAEEEAPVVVLEALPQDHVLRVRQTALTQGVETLSSPLSSDAARLMPPPTRGSLMRQFTSPPAAAATQAAPWSGWSRWLGGKPGSSL